MLLYLTHVELLEADKHNFVFRRYLTINRSWLVDKWFELEQIIRKQHKALS